MRTTSPAMQDAGTRPATPGTIREGMQAYRQGYEDGLAWQNHADGTQTRAVAMPEKHAAAAQLSPYIEQLRNDHMAAIAEAEHASQALEQYTQHNRTMKAKLEEQNTHIQAVQASLRDTRRERDSHRRVSESLHAQMSAMRQELDGLREQARDARPPAHQPSADVARLDAQLAEERRLRADAARAHEAALAEVRAENQRLNRAVANGFSGVSAESEGRVERAERDARAARAASARAALVERDVTRHHPLLTPPYVYLSVRVGS